MKKALRDIKIDELVPGLATDILIAEHVLGWQEWQVGVYQHGPTYVVNTQTKMLERALDTSMLVPGFYVCEYPERDGEYSFSTRQHDAALVYELLPSSQQHWRLNPLETCQRALKIAQDKAMGCAL